MEEENNNDENTTIDLEVLYINEEGLILKKFRKTDTDYLPPTHSHPLFQSAINLIKETSTEMINIDVIMQVITSDIYSVKAPINDECYKDLIKKSELFKPFFEDLYKEMDEIYYDEVKYYSLKLDFLSFLQKEFGLNFELAEESDNIIISNCLAIMRKLNLTQQEIAEYFCKHFFY